jgi:RNA polymerase sigma-70 factor (ECF subfamily)
MRQAFLAFGLAVVVGQLVLAQEKSAAKNAGNAVGGEGAGSLKYHDGMADGKKSMAGEGPIITFGAPAGTKIGGIKIHGSRYGVPKAPDEDFLVYVLSGDRKRVLHAELVPYDTFDRGAEKWVTVKFSEPVEVTPRFWISLDFRAHQTKGVYVSYDNSTEGKNSRKGLPGMPMSETRDKADWMIEAVAAQ